MKIYSLVVRSNIEVEDFEVLGLNTSETSGTTDRIWEKGGVVSLDLPFLSIECLESVRKSGVSNRLGSRDRICEGKVVKTVVLGLIASGCVDEIFYDGGDWFLGAEMLEVIRLRRRVRTNDVGKGRDQNRVVPIVLNNGLGGDKKRGSPCVEEVANTGCVN